MEGWGLPQTVLNARHFQEWLKALTGAGHVLKSAHVEWIKYVGNGFPLFIALHVVVDVHGEDRVKDNEVVILRPSTAHVVAWSRGETRDGDRFVLIKEYRTPARNGTGFVWELPGGSSFKPAADPLAMAQQEFREETGIELPLDRFSVVGEAQDAPTVVGSTAFLARAELTNDEMDQLAKRPLEQRAYGNAAETERTYVYVFSRKQIMNPQLSQFGWNLRGMIAAATEAEGGNVAQMKLKRLGSFNNKEELDVREALHSPRAHRAGLSREGSPIGSREGSPVKK